jgi:hypothetical protein
MVDFGLKLEDNKVSEWSDKYIRYEILKAILVKAGQVADRQKEISAKKPEEAEKIEDDYRRGLVTPIRSLSNASLRGISRENLSNIQEEQSPESAPLLSEADQAYGSAEMERITSTNSLISKLSHAASSYFGKHGYEQQLRDTLKLLDTCSAEFEVALLGDVDTVNTFYTTKVEEIEGRVSFLKETVASSFDPPPPPPATDRESDTESASKSDAYLDTPLISPGRRSSFRNRLSQVAKHITFFNMTPRTQSRSRKISDIEVYPSMEDDENDGSKKGSAEEIRKVREAESIQRALVDIYRVAKLLSNYVIMNYTGFVKIVKKHDKTIKYRKGAYKDATKPNNVCNEGKEVEVLTQEIEQLYANW